MNRRPPRSTRTAPLLPYTTLLRSRPRRLRSEKIEQRPALRCGHAGEALGEPGIHVERQSAVAGMGAHHRMLRGVGHAGNRRGVVVAGVVARGEAGGGMQRLQGPQHLAHRRREPRVGLHRSEEHTSELQSLLRISYAVFCLTKKKTEKNTTQKHK